MALAGHHIPDLVNIIVLFKCDQLLCLHKMADRHALVDQAGRGVGVVSRCDDSASVLFCQLPDRQGSPGPFADNNAVCLHLDSAELRFIAVSQDYQVMGLDIKFHHIRVCRRNQNLSLVKIRIGVSDYQIPLQGVQNIGILGIGL